MAGKESLVEAREEAAEEMKADSALPRRKVTRENRKPFGSIDQKLAWPPRLGYHQHWFNDEPGRIHTAREAGYEHVHDHDDRPVSRVVGIAQGGGPLLGYLMEIPQEWYEEDVARQQKIVDDKMNAIKRGYVEKRDAKDAQSFYAGSDRGQIDIRDSTGRLPR